MEFPNTIRVSLRPASVPLRTSRVLNGTHMLLMLFPNTIQVSLRLANVGLPLRTSVILAGII